MATQGPNFFLDRTRLLVQARALAPGYARATPHPHAVLDGLFGEEAANQLAKDFPGPQDARWKFRDHPQMRRYGHLQAHGFADVAPSLRHALAELNGIAFLDFLEALTGVAGLIGDPHFTGAGLHLTPPGGFLALHTDFNRDSKRGLARAVTVLFYLNPDWQQAWGGELEIWAEGADAATLKIAPICDRLVVMAHSEVHPHGQPAPLACPPDRFRASLAAYYYVARPDDATPAHGAIWKR
jgi:Rps23 Pro-64 3,4-dihydroxylase Tpa1-like proline 4-hydroxylase